MGDKISMNNERTKYSSLSIVILISILIYSFMVYTLSSDKSFIDIPHIVVGIPPYYIALFFLIISFFVYIFIKKKVKIDIICILLFIRIAIHLYTTINIDIDNGYITNITTDLLCLLIYIYSINYNGSYKDIYNIFIFIFVLICSQTIIESFLGKYTFFDSIYNYKQDLVIPIGGSNSIASKIVPIYAFLMCGNYKKKNKILLSCLLFITVIITKSRGGIILSFVAIGLPLFFKKDFRYSDFFKILFVIIILIISFLFFVDKTNIGKKSFSDSNSSIIERFDRWNNDVSLFEKHPIIGNGFSKEVMEKNPHNFLFSILIRSGLIGIVLFLLIGISFFTNTKQHLNNDVMRGCYCLIICMLVHGLIENVIFTYICDTILWLFIGLGKSISNKKELER